MSDPTAVITVKDLSHRYDVDEVLSCVSFQVHAGEVVGVLGVSGSGKSTLLRAVAGFVCPSAGSIHIGSREVCRDGCDLVPAEKRGIGLMFQDYALFPHMSVADNIMYGIHRDPDRLRRLAELLELVDLCGFEARRPASLSGGQKQRVALARALAPRPAALLLDEPFANLDGPMRKNMGHTIRDVLRSQNVAGMLVTHDRSEALALSDRVAVLGTGASTAGEGATVLQLDTPDRVFTHPNSIEAARLTGPIVTIDGVAAGGRADTVFGSIPLNVEVTGPGKLLIRRHQLVFESSPAGDCLILDRQYVGPGQLLLVECPIGPIWVSHGAEDAAIGYRGQITIRGAVAFVPI